MARIHQAAHVATEQKKRPKKGLDFRFFLVVCVLLAATGVFILVQHQYSVSSDLKVREIDEAIEVQKANQKSLRISLARLKSPARITRLAQDELGMNEPTGVIYLRYSRNENGNLVCQSTFEEKAKAPPKKVDNVNEPEPANTGEPSEPLTRR
jgi:cell division protein FtsL